MHHLLKDFQIATVEYGIKNPYSIYALAMGTGKSFCALATAIETNSKALIVAPAYLRLKWKSEIEKFYPGETVSLFTNDKEFYPVWDSRFVIISYHYLPKADSFFEWADMVIVDEAHHFKTMSSKRSEALHKLVYENSVSRLLLLTGTPLINRVYEFYSLIALCNYNPKINNSKFLDVYPSFVDFANHFSYLTEFEMYRGSKRVMVQKWEGFRNVEEMKEYLENIYIRFTTEVLGLEEPIEIEVPVSYEDNPELLEEFSRFTDKGDQTSVASDVKAKAALAKVPFTAEYVKNLLDQCEQVVVYTDHVASCIALAEKLGATPITGQTPMSKRQELADEFMAKKSQVIVATIGSFSTGIDLISAHTMVFNDVCWTPGGLDQAMFRIRRIGQKFQCSFHFILGSYQDKVIWAALKEKILTISKVV